MKIISILISILVAALTNAFALEVVDLAEGETAYVNVSDKELNVIKFPVNIRVLTKSNALEIENNDKRVFVSFKTNQETGAIGKAPEHLYFLTKDKTYSMALVPKKIPAVTVIAKIKDGLNKEALKWEKENPFVFTVKDLMKSMYNNNPPNGYEISHMQDNETELNGITKILDIKYIGATLTGEVYKVTNTSKGNMRLKEQLFYSKNVVAVSIDSHELEPNKETEVYIVRRSDVSEKQKGSFEVLTN